MQDSQLGIIAAGDLYMDFYDDNRNQTGFVLAGNCQKLAIKIETEQKENKLNGKYTYGQTADSFPRITSSTISLLFNRYDPALLGSYFMGEAEQRTGTGGTVSSEQITARLGKFVELAHSDISAVTVKDNTGATTYVSGTDYDLNTAMGMVRALKGGAITDGSVLKVGYTWAAESGYKVKGSTRPIVNVALRLDGTNNSDGLPIRVYVWKAQIRPDGEFDIMGEDYQKLSFSGTMITPQGKTWPFEVI